MTEVGASAGGVLLAFAAWTLMFRLDRRDIWPRTWIAAAVVGAYSLAAAAALGRLHTVLGPVGLTEAGLGAAVGLAYVAVTHLGAAVIRRVTPAFLDQVSDLYSLSDGVGVARIAGPLVAMGVAEELLFRGLIQGGIGVAAAIAAYAAVQVIEWKVALVFAAVLGGVVWGALFAWTHGLVAPIVAHLAWTTTLLFVWPLRRGPAPSELGDH